MGSKNIILIAAVGPALFGAIGIVFLKRAAGSFGDLTISSSFWVLRKLLCSPDFWGGIFLYAAAFAWLMIALPHVKVNQFYPVAVGFNILFTSTAAWLILSETISLPQVIGVVLIIAGIFFVTR